VPVISATKLQVPVHRTGLVPREALVALLAGALTSRLTLLCAPAGSGKTTLLTQWHRAEQREFAWVSLDEEDNDPVRFWSCALEALQTVAPGVGAAAAGALTGPGTSISDVVVPLLVNDLAALTTPVVLVLDDLHTVHEPRVHEPLGRLIEREPPQLHIALASRAEPPLPLGRLRARGELTELRAADLRFSDDEAAVLLNDGFGLMLADDDIAALQRRTDG